MSKITEFRCLHCGKLLFKACLSAGSHLEIVCPRNNCKRTSVFTTPNHLTTNGKNGTMNLQLHENLERQDRP